MEKLLVHITEVRNDTDQVIGFEVENGYFHLRALPPGKKRHVKLWKVVQACCKHKSARWKIRFMMNEEFSGVNASQLLHYARIIIKLESNGERPCLPYLEAIFEKPIDYWLRLKYLGCMRDKNWDKRPSIRIWPDPTCSKYLRVVEAPSPPQLVVPVANPSLLQSCQPIRKLPPEAESNEMIVNSSPLPEGPGPAAGFCSPEREKKAVSFHTNDEKRIISTSLPAAAEHGPERERISGRRPDNGGYVEELERSSAVNMPELAQQREDDDLSSSINSIDIEKIVRLMLFIIAFMCVLLFKFGLNKA